MSFDENENLIETPLKRIDGVYHLARNSSKKKIVFEAPFSKLTRFADKAWKNETDEVLEVVFTCSIDRELTKLVINPNQIFYFREPSVGNLAELGVFEIC